MEAAQDGEPAVKARWASFAWERETAPALHDVSLEAIKGQLVMVVGVVGSGKSSLIAALLGELHSRGGTVEVLCVCKVLS
jgi:ABC-type Mn2+/Zn2+ transport system ATPase subunit